MRARTLGSLGVGLLLCNLTMGAQTPTLPQGAPMPGPPAAPRPQAPTAPARDGATQPAVGTGKILGRVVSAETSSPLRRAQVRIVAAEQRVVKTATTDAEGRYQFSELPAGRYSISVTRNGYVSLSFGQQRPFEPGKPLELANAQVAERIDFALPRGGVIAGRITDEVGEPLAGVGMRAMRYQYQPDGRRRLTPTSGVGMPYGIQTDDLGQFRVYGLMPGSYVVSASVNPMGGSVVMPMPGGGMVSTVGSNDGSDGYTTTYYPGTASEGEAQAVTVTIGQEAAAVFSMIPARLSQISGVIRNSQGRPATNINFTVRPSQMMMMGPGSMFGGVAGPDGGFMMQNVPPGEYVIEVRPMMGRGSAVVGAPAQEPEFASVPLTVSGQTINGLVITTGPGASISGRVVFDTTNPPLPAPPMMGSQPLRVMFTTADVGLSMGLMMLPDNGVIDSTTGRFELRGVNGKGTLRVSGTMSAVKSVTLEGVEIIDTPYEFKTGGNTAGLEITLTNSQTTLTGGVRNVLGGAAKDYVVAIFPGNLRDGDNPSRFVRTVRPDQDGKFQTKGLPAGDYFAVAVETLEQGEQWDPAFQDHMRPRAKGFKLSEGQSLTLDLSLIN